MLNDSANWGANYSSNMKYITYGHCWNHPTLSLEVLVLYVDDPNLTSIIVPADGLAPIGAKPSTGMVMKLNSDMSSLNYSGDTWFKNCLSAEATFFKMARETLQNRTTLQGLIWYLRIYLAPWFADVQGILSRCKLNLNLAKFCFLIL